MPDYEIMPNKTYFVNRFYRFFIFFVYCFFVNNAV